MACFGFCQCIHTARPRPESALNRLPPTKATTQLVKAYNLARSASLAYLVQGHLLCAQGQWQAAIMAYTQARQSYAGRVQPLWHLRAQAGLASCWFSAGNRAQAIAQIEELLPALTEGKRGGEMNIYESILISYEILTVTADPRAVELLHWGYCLLQEQAAHFDDEALRHTFLPRSQRTVR